MDAKQYESKHISNIKSILSNMPKIVQDVTKPPKSLKQLWQVFKGYDEKIQDDLDKIRIDLNSNKKHQKIRTACSVGAVIAVIISAFIAYGGIVGLLHPPPEHIEVSDVRANEDIFRILDIQIYTLTITNYGDKLANNLRIEIEFPKNITINEIQNDDGLLIPNPEGGKDTNFYNPYYENINVNETIEIRLILKHTKDEFIPEESWEVPPKKRNIWTDDGDVSIS